MVLQRLGLLLSIEKLGIRCPHSLSHDHWMALSLSSYVCADYLCLTEQLTCVNKIWDTVVLVA